MIVDGVPLIRGDRVLVSSAAEIYVGGVAFDLSLDALDFAHLADGPRRTRGKRWPRHKRGVRRMCRKRSARRFTWSGTLRRA